MQSALKKLPKILQFGLVTLLILLGFLLLVWSQIKPYQLNVNGETIRMRTIAFHPRDLFGQAGIPLRPQDRLSVDSNRFDLAIPQQIRLTSARPITLTTPNGKEEILTAELIPANIFQEAGIRLFPNDIILINDEVAQLDRILSPAEPVRLELIPAKQVDIYIGDQYQTTLFTQKETFQEALEEAGLDFNENDRFSPSLGETLQQSNKLIVTLAEEVCVTASQNEICGLSAGETVAEVLADLHITPQHLDYAQPTENDPLPTSRKVTFHQVEERLVLQTDETAFAYSYKEDPNTQLDTTSVLVPGQPGIEVWRTYERFEDGTLLTSTSEDPWKASDSRDGVMGMGTRAVMQTETVDGETIEFWRKVNVYATSYHPSTFGDNARTRSGLPLAKGTIAVSAAWYPSMALQPVYVQGYGHATIGDSGGGIPGTYWIDLGYSDADYVGWHSWTTLYFLAPIPAWYPTVLP
ncbi:MAG: ubiquitin-like domain-containing protein [Anaerolineaceae bacterium]